MEKFTSRILLGWDHVRLFWNLTGIMWRTSNPLLAEHNFLLLKTELNKGYWSISQGFLDIMWLPSKSDDLKAPGRYILDFLKACVVLPQPVLFSQYLAWVAFPLATS